ncbi:MAG: hypothetical protein Q8K30_01135 [Candidatus Gracilibacteria bacterium]|nr:hypothetical protein [Candidatus Gracilibacteria bacterium]
MIGNSNSLKNVFSSKNTLNDTNVLSNDVQKERKRFSDKVSARLEGIFF